MLGHHFTQERLQYGLYGLYPRYRPYTEPIIKLLAMFGHALVVTTMHTYRGLLADKRKPSRYKLKMFYQTKIVFLVCEYIWPALVDIYSPWLTPYWTKSLKDVQAAWIQQLTDDRAAVLPWIHADGNRAQKFVTAFVNNIRFIIDMLPGKIFRRSPLTQCIL